MAGQTGEKTPLNFLSHLPPYGSIKADMPAELPVDEHCHQNRVDNGKHFKKARRKLILASVLCVVFMVAEIVGGVFSSSLAIATDAAHLLTDFAGFMISLFALWIGQRKPSRMMPFGWYRAEVIGALLSVLTIWVVTGVLVYIAIERVISLDFEIDTTIMLITSGIGVLVNIVMGLTLHQHSHSHEPRNNNEELGKVGAEKEKNNINVRAAFIHVLGDFIQSVGVFIAAGVIHFKPEWKIVDPICTFLFSILVLFTTFAIIKETLIVLMEGLPRDIDFAEVMNTFLDIEGVMAVHNLRIWALSSDKIALAAHLAIKPGTNPQAVLKQASNSVHQKYNFFEMTLQIENFLPKMEDCAQCQDSADIIRSVSPPSSLRRSADSNSSPGDARKSSDPQSPRHNSGGQNSSRLDNGDSNLPSTSTAINETSGGSTGRTEPPFLTEND